jgi:heme o synthase
VNTSAVTDIAVAADSRAGELSLVAATLLLARPGIVAATVLSGFTGMVVTGRGLPPVGAASALITAVALAAAGSAMINALIEEQSDRKMSRLTRRVAALERLGRQRAVLIALSLAVTSALCSILHLNRTASLLIVASILTYTILYTALCKHRSPWGTLIGGIPGALPPLIGASAVAPGIDTGGLLLFLIIFLWQQPHFWALALHCRDDYRRADIPVLPLVHGERTALLLIVGFTLLLLPATLSPWMCGICGTFYGVAALALWAFFFGAIIMETTLRRRFRQAFICSIIYLSLLQLGAIIDICFAV